MALKTSLIMSNGLLWDRMPEKEMTSSSLNHHPQRAALILISWEIDPAYSEL